jgi:hypothetical protein
MRTLLFLLVLGTAQTLAAQTTVATYTGERTRDLVKDCFYEAPFGEEYTKSVSLYTLCPLSIRVALRAAVATSGTATKTGERRRGTTKDCYYRLGHDDYVHTVNGFDLCPLTLDVGGH